MREVSLSSLGQWFQVVLQGPVKSGFLTPRGKDRGPRQNWTDDQSGCGGFGAVFSGPNLTPVQFSV